MLTPQKVFTWRNRIAEISTREDLFPQKVSVNAMLIDFLIERTLHGVTLPNYLEYGFYFKNRRCRQTFICRRDAFILYDLCNKESLRYLTADKGTFNKRFNKYLHRKWIDIKVCNYDAFCAFLDEVDQYIVKPSAGERGLGVEIVDRDDRVPRQDLYEKYRQQEAVIEETIKQNKAMASLHPESVNTLRVVTIRDTKGTIHILGAAIRIGTGKECVDNYHHNGICAVVDVKTGVVCSRGVNYDMYKYYVHPDTSIPIIGFMVPNWEKVIETVKSAAKLLPELNLIGWDLAIDDHDNVVIIEGNSTPEFALFEAPNQEGIMALCEPFIQEYQRSKR